MTCRREKREQSVCVRDDGESDYDESDYGKSEEESSEGELRMFVGAEEIERKSESEFV